MSTSSSHDVTAHRSFAQGVAFVAFGHGFGALFACTADQSGPSSCGRRAQHGAPRPMSVTESQIVRAKGDRTCRTWKGRSWSNHRHDTIVAVARPHAVTGMCLRCRGYRRRGSQIRSFTEVAAMVGWYHRQDLFIGPTRTGIGGALWADPNTSDKAGSRSRPPRRHRTCGR